MHLRSTTWIRGRGLALVLAEEGAVMILRWLVMFAATAAADVCWARYVGHVSKGSRWLAATWASWLYLLGAVAVVGYTENHWLFVPAVLGAFVGTAVGVKR